MLCHHLLRGKKTVSARKPGFLFLLCHHLLRGGESILQSSDNSTRMKKKPFSKNLVFYRPLKPGIIVSGKKVALENHTASGCALVVPPCHRHSAPARYFLSHLIVICRLWPGCRQSRLQPFQPFLGLFGAGRFAPASGHFSTCGRVRSRREFHPLHVTARSPLHLLRGVHCQSPLCCPRGAPLVDDSFSGILIFF